MDIKVDGSYAEIHILSGHMKGKYIVQEEIFNEFFLVKTHHDLNELDYYDHRLKTWKKTYKTNFTTILSKALNYIENQNTKKINETKIGYIDV